MSIRGLRRWSLLLTFWVALHARHLQAQVISGNTVDGNFTVTGTTTLQNNIDIQGNTISAGTRTDNSNPGWGTIYTDGTTSSLEFDASRSANVWKWQQNAGATLQLQMTLDDSSTLKLYNSSGAAEIALTPTGTSYFYTPVEFYGNNNQMANQTLVGPGSVLTEGLADSRYLPSSNSAITIGSEYGTGYINNQRVKGTTIGLNGGTVSGAYSLYAFAEGENSTASGYNSVAMGGSATASGNSVAMGQYATATGSGSVAIGGGSSASSFGAMALGSSSATGTYSTAIGVYSTASGAGSMALGWYTTASGSYSTTLGAWATASGSDSMALGAHSNASNGSTAIGGATATGAGSMAIEGGTALGNSSMAIGGYAAGNSSIAIGGNAIGSNSMALRGNARGNFSTTIGQQTTASGYYATASGYMTTAQAYDSFVIGTYNVGGGNSNGWVGTDPLFEIGNGMNTLSTATYTGSAYYTWYPPQGSTWSSYSSYYGYLLPGTYVPPGALCRPTRLLSTKTAIRQFRVR